MQNEPPFDTEQRCPCCNSKLINWSNGIYHYECGTDEHASGDCNRSDWCAEGLVFHNGAATFTCYSTEDLLQALEGGLCDKELIEFTLLMHKG